MNTINGDENFIPVFICKKKAAGGAAKVKYAKHNIAVYNYIIANNKKKKTAIRLFYG